MLLTLVFVTALSGQTPSPLPKVVETYCAGCHDGSRVSPSGARLPVLDTSHIADNPVLWSRAERHLRAGTMPPFGAPRPDRRTSDEAVVAIERALDTPAPASADSKAIATRLAKLLWNAEPDAALNQAANRDELRDTAAVEEQVRRMLADSRTEAFVSKFFFPWLQLDKLGDADLRRETELFLLSQLREDRDPIELWTANYSFLNEQLAKLYGIANVTGSEFRKVTLPPERAGLLGQGSFLTATSRADSAYTSPASRAKWVLTRFFGVSTPNPFPGAQPVSPDLPITPQTRRLAANPCMNCHVNFFPLAYALENFDPIGRWRARDQEGPIDATATFVDGTKIDGPAELRNGLMKRPDAFRTTVTERLLTYASGGAFVTSMGTPDTLATARRILHDQKQVRWSTVIAAIIR
jgi:hypothetical protein